MRIARMQGLKTAEENPETLRQELMELAEATIRIREENADLRLKLAGSKAYANRGEIELGRVLLERFHLRRQLAEFTAVRTVNKPFIPPKEADHAGS